MKRTNMRNIKEVLRLHFENKELSTRQIGGHVRISHTAVANYLQRFNGAGLSWPLPEDLTSIELEMLLFPEKQLGDGKSLAVPDWKDIHHRLGRKGHTLQFLHDQYRIAHPDGYSYSYFCKLYKIWKKAASTSMLQVHKPGDKLFVDFAGMTLAIQNPANGETWQAQVFVSALGVSHLIYAQATETQNVHDFISGQVGSLEYMDGVPNYVVPDNPKTAVIKTCLYEPKANATFRDVAEHYDFVILPARSGKPQDKSKVELAVSIVERWVLAPLSYRIFLSLDEANQAISQKLEDVNGRFSKHMGGSRFDLFEKFDRPALKPLPAERYEYGDWRILQVPSTYHLRIDLREYSVPYELVGEKVDVRTTKRTVEIFHKNDRVASHVRTPGFGDPITNKDHMPAGHRFMADLSLEDIHRKAKETGPQMEKLLEAHLAKGQPFELLKRTFRGLFSLHKSYGTDRFESACIRALATGTISYTSVKSILQNGLDGKPLERAATAPAIKHCNIRGPEAFK